MTGRSLPRPDNGQPGERPPGSVSAPAGCRAAGFDFTAAMRRLCEDVTTRAPEMRHIDMRRVAVSFAQARKRTAWGIHATLTPLRFENGARTTRRRGRLWTMQRLYDGQQREMLYILCFYLPRFLDTPLREKLITVFHELWHISPRFDGDVRRHAGRCYAHTSSQKQYDAHMARLVERWLEAGPPETLYAFLRQDFDTLRRTSGRIVGVRVPHPKLLPAESPDARRRDA